MDICNLPWTFFQGQLSEEIGLVMLQAGILIQTDILVQISIEYGGSSYEHHLVENERLSWAV